MTALVFLSSALTSYASIRSRRKDLAHQKDLAHRLELVADQCFLVGLVSIVMISMFFAYEII